MQFLRTLMHNFLEDWRADVPAEWHQILDGVEPDFAAINSTLMADDDEVVFPGRRDQEPDGAPDGSHVFRALEGIAPADVRVVVIGQDPYPDISKATGRAFDQGGLANWTSANPRPAKSLKPIAQQVAAFRLEDATYQVPFTGWTKTEAAIAAEDLALQSCEALFDHWQDQGVVFLNTSLTLTRYQPGGHPHQLKGHIPMWAPVVGEICLRLAKDDATPVVFLCWGKQARQFLSNAGITKTAAFTPVLSDGVENTAVLVRSHPVTNGFLAGENLFVQTNATLLGLGGAPIAW